MKKIIRVLTFAVVALFGACSAPKPFYGKGEGDWKQKQLPSDPLKHTVYIMGGLDYEHHTVEESFNLLKNHLDINDTAHSVAFLNDRIYKNRRDNAGDIDRTASEKQLNGLLDFLKKDKGHVYFIAGHDLANGKKNYDPEIVRKYVESKLEKKDIFYPKNGCPGPDKVWMTDDLLLVPLNTSYFLWEQEDKQLDCDIENETRWVEEIKEVIDDNQRKNLLVLGHHPLINLGNHGGWFSLKQHVFPLTDIHRSLYVPLPVIGTLYPLFRIAFGHRNDRAYPPYNKMRKNLARTFYNYKNVVYASGLEQNFQYFKYNGQDYIIANSADDSKWTGTIRSKFTYAANGLVKLYYFKNGEVWMEFITTDPDNEKGKIVYRKRLKDNVYESPNDSTAIEPSVNVSDSSLTIIANKNLEAGKFKTFFLGHHYREAWAAPVKVPVIDLQKEQGGLEIVKKGGGNQTKSLHLVNKKGEELTLRSVVKYPENLLGPLMTNTIAADLVRDQTSSIHPYTPFVIDNLSEAVGVLHNDPKIVFIPNDRQLAEYRKEFANTLAVLEKKADGNIAPADNFLFVENAISSDKLMKLRKKSNAVVVDDYALLKSRLFDMWINDWDRHQDQWRWGQVECEQNPERCKLLNAGKDYYVPIPKDRDQAFARFDGVIPWVAGRRWTGRRFQHFSEDVKDVTGLNYNARNFDRAFLSRLNRDDWNRMAKELQQELTDKKIENAIRQFPDTIYKLDGAEMIRTLKSRRDKMNAWATRYYEFIAQYVDVQGSDEKEIFEIKRIDDDSTLVQVFNGENEEKQLLYSRTFLRNETKEIRIYGKDGEDEFTISGQVEKGILIRIIGGDDKDRITDNSTVKRGCKKTKIYDDIKENSIDTGSEAKDLTSSSKDVNDYVYDSFRYHLIAPAAFFGYNRDDGLFLGGGAAVKYQGFRKNPYSFRQRIVANVALKETSFNLMYTGDFIEVFGKWGIHIDATVLAPRSTTNFFGLGNETIRIREEDVYYRLRYDDIFVYPGMKRRVGKHHSVKIGPVYEYISVEKTSNRFITSPEGQPYFSQATPRNLGGAKMEYEFQSIDDSVLTFRGIKWLISGISQATLSGKSYSTTNIESQLNVYIPIANRATVAMRFGGAARIGDFDFFQANTLGGHSLRRENGNLRGHLRGRFSGRSVAYLNTDLRMKLFTFRTYLFPAHFGILGFYDTGRVWADNEKSDKWHNGYGGGIWIDPLAMTIINLNYAVSKEEKLVTLAIGFLF